MRASAPGVKSMGTIIRAKNAPTSPVERSTAWLCPVERRIGAWEEKMAIVVAGPRAWTRSVPPKARKELKTSRRSTTLIVPHWNGRSRGTAVARVSSAWWPRPPSAVQYSTRSGSKWASVGRSLSATTRFAPPGAWGAVPWTSWKPRLATWASAWSKEIPSRGARPEATAASDIAVTSAWTHCDSPPDRGSPPAPRRLAERPLSSGW